MAHQIHHVNLLLGQRHTLQLPACLHGHKHDISSRQGQSVSAAASKLRPKAAVGLTRGQLHSGHELRPCLLA